jgi:hypothetical protein
MQNPIRCAICEVDMPNKESLALHLLGKRHLRGLQLLEQKKVAEEKGIYVRGLSSFVFSFSYGHVSWCMVCGHFVWMWHSTVIG